MLSAPVRPVVGQAAQGHAVFGDEERQAVSSQVLDEKGEPLGQHAPVPPLAGHALEHPVPDGTAAHVEIAPARPAQGVRDERVVIIEGDVIERHFLPLIEQRRAGGLQAGETKPAAGDEVMQILEPLADEIARAVHGEELRGIETLVEILRALGSRSSRTIWRGTLREGAKSRSSRAVSVQ